NKKVLIGKQASRGNFMRYMADYRIINIFSHAEADTTDTEPRLYMHDSLIHLSELQALGNKTAVELLVLSACKTNAGKNAAGEGVYSLARGFASIGVPAVAATLWEADEQSIYSLTALFHQYLSQGTSKDLALQHAKIDFIKLNNKSEKSA
ncbi:MAG: CHAT domain-containing protein, partial [Ignavibacteriota bacterium]